MPIIYNMIDFNIIECNYDNIIYCNHGGCFCVDGLLPNEFLFGVTLFQ